MSRNFNIGQQVAVNVNGTNIFGVLDQKYQSGSTDYWILRLSDGGEYGAYTEQLIEVGTLIVGPGVNQVTVSTESENTSQTHTTVNVHVVPVPGVWICKLVNTDLLVVVDKIVGKEPGCTDLFDAEVRAYNESDADAVYDYVLDNGAEGRVPLSLLKNM